MLRLDTPRKSAEGEVDEIPLEEGKNKTVLIGAALEGKVRKELIDFLITNQECFAWSHQDMTRINLAVITHKLNVKEDAKPVKQK